MGFIERWELVEILIRDSLKKEMGAEIGVWRGKTTHHILKQLPQLHLICVDPYKVYDHFKNHHDMGKYESQVEFSALAESLKYDLIKKYGKRVIWYQKESLEVAPLIKDGSLDFVFVDANYGYKYVKEDILAWLPKIRSGGIMIGHNITSKKDNTGSVKQAVEETIGKDYRVREGRWYYVLA